MATDIAEVKIRKRSDIAARFELRPDMTFLGFTTRASDDVAAYDENREVRVVRCRRRDVWICLIPCVAMHIVWRGPESLDEDGYPF